MKHRRIWKQIGGAVFAALLLCCLSQTAVFAAGERATFDTGENVRAAWNALAGGRTNVKEIRQYTGDAVPESVTTRVVSASNSQTPIYSWFEDGTIYYWSEDPHPYTNPDSSYMFYSYTEASFIDTAPLDTSKTTDMEGMFAYCSSVRTIDVSGFDTSSARCMYVMFYMCSSLEELDVSHFNTTRATQTSHGGYGSLCGMFINCSSLKMLDLSSFDMTVSGWPYHTQNMFPGCSSLEKLILGPNVRFNNYTSLSGSWTHVEDGMTLSGGQLTSTYNAANSLQYSGTWIRNMPEGHYYRTDGSLGQTNLWEVHSPGDKFKGYCLNLNRFGVGEELDRVLAEDDAEIIKLLCTEEQGSTHGSAPLGATMREALITLIYYGWPNDAAGIQQRYGLSDQDYMEITQNAVWDFTDRYEDPAGPTHYEGNQLAAYTELVSQRFSNIEEDYILFLYESWDPSKQNLLSIMGVDDQEYGGVCIRKQNADGSENLAGAEFTIYDEEGNPVEVIESGPNGTAYACRTDHSQGLPLGNYTVRETKPPAGYELSDWEYHFEIKDANVIVVNGWRVTGVDPDTGEETAVVEEMIYFDDDDDTYEGGGVGILKKSDTGKMLVGAGFTIYNEAGEVVKTLVTNDAGVAMTGKQDLPLGTYTVTETKAPEGHNLPENPSQTITISKNFDFLTLTFEDTEKKGHITLEAKKILDIPEEELKEGQFTFQLLDAHGQVLQEKTNDAEGNIVFDTIYYTPDDLGYKNYSIREVLDESEDYTYDRHQEDVTVTIYDSDGDELLCEAIYDSDGAEFVNTSGGKKKEVEFLKKKLNSDTQLPGASIEIRDQAGRLVENWVSDGTPHAVKLDPGKYTVRELSAPDGYYKRSDLKIEIGTDGSIVCSDEEAYDAETEQITIYDTTISSTGLKFRKVNAETKSPLEDAEFTMAGSDEGNADYSDVQTSGKDGIVSFENLSTGTYSLTETKVPYGYSSEDSPWTVDVTYNKMISKTENVDANGVASGDYSSVGFKDTVTIPGEPGLVHVFLRYQTEDNYDYLLLEDAEGQVITEDAEGNPIGDTRSAYKGRIWGGMDDGELRELNFDLNASSVTFHFVPDENTAAYGYYAVITTDPMIEVTNSDGEVVELSEDGLYDLPNKEEEKIEATAEIKASKLLKGRDWKESDSFTFELAADDETFPMPEKTEVSVSDETEVSFGTMTFEAEGLYTYTVREKKGDIEGITYDETAHKVTVDVRDSGEENQLVAEVIYEDSESDTSVVFTNTYKEEKPDEPERPDAGTKGDVPNTKDELNGPLQIVLVLLSAAGIAAIIFARRKQAGNRKR